MTELPIRFEMIRWKEGGILSLNKFGHAVITQHSLQFKQIPTPPIQLGSSIVGLIAAVIAGHLLYSPLLVVAFVFGGRRAERVVAARLNQDASSHTQQTISVRPDDVLRTRHQSKFSLVQPRGVLTLATLNEQVRIYGLKDDLQELDNRVHTQTFVDETIYCTNCGEQMGYSEPVCSDCGEPIHEY